MRLRLLAGGFGMGLVAGLLCTTVLSEPSDADAQTADERQQQWEEMFAKWEKYGTPGKHHSKLKYFVGEWDVTVRSWWEGPEKEPTENKSVYRAELIFGDRFLKTEVSGTIEFEDPAGNKHVLPMQGLSITGYDSFKEKYTNMWIDSTGTSMYYAEGTIDPTGKVVRYFGTADEWATGERDKPVMMVDRIIDEDHAISEMHDMTLPAGKTMVMQFELERVQKKRQH